MSWEWELQVAIYTKLTADITPLVYSDGGVPDNVESLYVVIGNDTAIEWDTDGSTGFESTVTIHTWDTGSSGSYKLCKELMGNIYDSLHRASLTVTGYDVVGIDQELSESFIDADGLTRHGVQRFRIFARQS